MIIKTKYNAIICKGCKIEELAKIRSFIIKQAIKNGFDNDEAQYIALATEEACTNIIKYGYQFDRTKEIEILTYKSKDFFIVEINDEGKPFNPNDINEIDMKKYFQEFKKGGLGIQIIKKIMDDIEYYPAENEKKKNSLLLKKLIPSN